MLRRISVAIIALGLSTTVNTARAEGPDNQQYQNNRDMYQGDTQRRLQNQDKEYRDPDDPRAQPRLGPADPDSLGSTLGAEPDYPINRDRGNRDNRDYREDFQYGQPDEGVNEEDDRLEVD